MRSAHPLLASALVCALAAPGSALAQDAAAQALVNQARYWQELGDAERAGEAWQKVLRTDPTQPDALYGMAQAELAARRPEGAQRYLAQLQRAHPASPLVARLQQALRAGSVGASPIEAARALARKGQGREALAAYQVALGGRAPSGPLALEYYQTLGGTPDGWDEARRGLASLAQASPGDTRVALAYAQHLSYRDATRREGIAGLARLASQPGVGAAASESWRKALGWVGTRPADAGLYRDYLRAHPGDAQVQAWLAEAQGAQHRAAASPARPADPLRQRSAAGFRALQADDLPSADAAFTRVLATRTRDADALGGLGIVRLRQGQFAAARELLTQASQAGTPARWAEALASASYWALVADATAARERGDNDVARGALQQAVQLKPGEATAQVALADLLLQTGQPDAAEVIYRQVLARQGDHPDALRGLVALLERGERSAEALELMERLPAAVQDKVGALGRLRATQALGQARAAVARGDEAAARAALDNALASDPANPWVRLDLARLALRVGSAAEARAVMQGLLQAAGNPLTPEALYASALLASETADWQAALDLLARIPAPQRTADMAVLQQRAALQLQVDAAVALSAQGRPDDARATLAQATVLAGQNLVLLGVLAQGHADAGDTGRALELARQMMALSPRPDAAMQLQYALVLFAAREDAALLDSLRTLHGLPLAARERASLADIERAFTVRRADALREAGDRAGALALLAPLLQAQPGEPQLLAAQARVLAASGDYAGARALYERLLQAWPGDVPLLVQALDAATDARDDAHADTLAARALAAAPADAQVLAAAGRLARVQGRTQRAQQLLATAQATGRAPAAARDALRDIRESRATAFTVGVVGRVRTGEAGLNQLTEVEAPIQVQWAAGDGLLSLRITPADARAGTVGSGYGSASRFGGGPVAALEDTAARTPGHQGDTGVGVGVAYETGGLRLDLGTTPLRLGHVDLTGGVRYRTPLDPRGLLGPHWTAAVEASRRVVTDSLLSLAGARDARTGERWGGVLATGLRAQLGWDDGRRGGYGYGAWHTLTGEGVRSNSRTELGGGLYWHLHRTPDADLTAGVSATLLAYDHNLRYYTAGHGGYFSPQRFASLALPVEWMERSGRLSYQLRGSLGVQYFSEDAAPYFPGSGLRQAQAALAASGQGATASYAGQSRTGLGYSLGGAVEYQWQPQVFVGGHLAVDNARNFREVAGGLYVRYALQPITGPMALPVQPLRSPYSPPY